jgi:hypothetical protein
MWTRIIWAFFVLFRYFRVIIAQGLVCVELANGFTKKNYNREQFFVTNTIASIATIGVTHLFQSNYS